MQFLVALIAILGVGAFWWYRMKNVAEAANDINDVAGRAWGKYKRYKFRKKAEASPVEAVQDPIAAAVVMMMAMVKEESELTPEAEETIKREAMNVMRVDDAIELMTFSKWVASHVQDANSVSLRYSKIWANALNREERVELADMVERAATSVAPLTRNQQVKLSKLRERLGLLN